MKLRDYFVNATTEEITERLKYLDKAIYELHTIKSENTDSGRYVVGDLADIEIINGDITIDSFHDKYDYLNSGINENGRTNNIVQLCCIGICAYCRLSVLHTSPEFIESLIENIDMYLERANMPSEMQQYYIDVFCRKKITYLNDFLMNKMIEYNENESSRSNGRGSYTKKTAIGEMFSDKNDKMDLIAPYTGSTGVSRTLPSYEKAAFASILVLPALLALIYIITVVVYFIFIK